MNGVLSFNFIFKYGKWIISGRLDKWCCHSCRL